MNTIPKITSFILCLFMSSLVCANEDKTIQHVPEFSGGLNISQITACEKKYKDLCPIVNAKSPMEGIVQQESCIEKKMAGDKSCIQASKIRQLTSYAPTALKQYGPVTVFNTTSLADGVTTFYMVDAKGLLIELTTNLDLDKDNNYLALKKKYPNLTLTRFLHWTKVNEDLFPNSQLFFNNDQQLIFKQELRDGDCVACAVKGVAEVAYEFNSEGAFLRSTLLKVTALN